MAIFLGEDKIKVNLAGSTWCFVIPSSPSVTNGTVLLSYDNHILQDSNGTFLTAKEGEQS